MKSWMTWVIVGAVVILVAIVAFNLGSKSSTEIPSAPSTESSTESGSSSASTTPVNENKVFRVEIENSAFNPAELTIKSGDNVTWINKDTIPHSLVSDSGSRSGIGSGIMENNNLYTVHFVQADTYSYHCKFHNTERGKIVVE